MEEKFSQILDDILRKRKSQKRNYSIKDLADEFKTSVSAMNKYLAGEFDKSDRMAAKIQQAKQIRKLIQDPDMEIGEDIHIMTTVTDLATRMDKAEKDINDLQRIILNIQNKLL